jgi:hypothetical protein
VRLLADTTSESEIGVKFKLARFGDFPAIRWQSGWRCANAEIAIGFPDREC